jgi:hypothetical protein
MPKSKRDKKISLTKVEKKQGLETKQKLVENIRTSVDNYARLVIIFHTIFSIFSMKKFSKEHPFLIIAIAQLFKTGDDI